MKFFLLINKRENTGLKHLNDSKAYIEYSTIWTIFIKISKNTIQNKKRKKLIIFDDIIADMLSNKKKSNSN